MASHRETTLRVSALRTVPPGVEHADVRSLITQGPISVGPPADLAADVRGPSAVALVADDLAVEFICEPVTQVAPVPPPLRVVEPHPEPQTAAPIGIAPRPPLPRWVTPALVTGGVALLGLLALAIGTTREAEPIALETEPPHASSRADEQADHAPEPASATPPPPPAADRIAPPTAIEPTPEATTPDNAELTLLIEEDHAKPEPQRRRKTRSSSRKPTADLLADGGVALAIGDRDTAVDTFEQVLRRRPKSAAAAAGLANAHFDEGRFDLAAAYATRAVKAEFKDPNHHVLLGDAYYRLGQRDDAEVQWTTAQRLGSARAARRLAKL